MILSELEIFAFKGIEETSCLFSPKLNGIFGGNGMGKTNLLDAIHYLSLVRSHLGTIDRLSIKKDHEEANLVGTYLLESGENERIALRIRAEKPKQLSRNGKLYPRLSDHIGRFPIVIISPQDYRLIRGGSSDRRRFLDRLLSQLNKNYLNELVKYEQALLQRNNILRQGMRDSSLLEILETQMALAGCKLLQQRNAFITRFSPLFLKLYKMVSGQAEPVSIHYLSECSTTSEQFLSNLKFRREQDFAAGTSTYGIHRDDLLLHLGDELIRKVGSEGQNKSFLVGIKFAEYMILSQETNCKPILLLDDLFDKLDESRVSNIISLVSQEDFGQIFITDTNRKHLDKIIAEQGGDYRLFEANKGSIKAFNLQSPNAY